MPLQKGNQPHWRSKRQEAEILDSAEDVDMSSSALNTAPCKPAPLVNITAQKNLSSSISILADNQLFANVAVQSPFENYGRLTDARPALTDN